MTARRPPDYCIRSTSPAPPGYPSAPSPDAFSERPFLPDFESRRRAYFKHILQNPAPENTKAGWHELARLAAGGRPHEGILHAALDFIDDRRDCADFVLHGILRLLYQSDAGRAREGGLDPVDSSTVSDELLERMRRTILDFKYFPDEPGVDSLCTWTENHYILFTSAAYLAGQLYPGDVFTNSGETGRQKMVRNRARILRWLDLRFRSGFSEWLSHVYYDEDLTALLALRDFAADSGLRSRAEMVIDLLLLDMALNSFRGVFGSTHGRSYEETKKWAAREGTADAFKLLFGAGVFSGFDSMSAAAFALSGYRLPAAIERTAGAGPFENRQRMGIRLAELERWGLHPDNFEDGMHCLTLEAYTHPRTIANTLRMFDLCNWWENGFLEDFKPFRGLLKAVGALGGLPLLARVLARDICRNTREQVDLYTWKTPDYMLSTAQDYRPGYGGDQQHIWQATLGPDAVCFTTHPARIAGVTPNYWAGSGLLPRAAQFRNVAVVIYKIERIPALYVPIRHFFTHAWLPRERFDEVLERAGWIFARRGEGYLALRSQNPYFWNFDGNPWEGGAGPNRPVEDRILDSGRDSLNEVVVPGPRNIWICQMGRAAEDGPFERFVESIVGAELRFGRLNVAYRSPGNGWIRFGWRGGFTVDGAEIPLHGYPRYENPWVQAPFDPSVIRVTAGDESLILDWRTASRRTTGG